MKWRAHVNNLDSNIALSDRHHFMTEVCEYIGACAKKEGTDALVEAIEGFLARPILEITGLACGGEVEFREFHLVGESCCDFPWLRANPNPELRAQIEKLRQDAVLATDWHFTLKPFEFRKWWASTNNKNFFAKKRITVERLEEVAAEAWQAGRKHQEQQDKEFTPKFPPNDAICGDCGHTALEHGNPEGRCYHTDHPKLFPAIRCHCEKFKAPLWSVTGLSGRQDFYPAKSSSDSKFWNNCDCFSNPHHEKCATRRFSSPVPHS
jgi:hypothetical protein